MLGAVACVISVRVPVGCPCFIPGDLVVPSPPDRPRFIHGVSWSPLGLPRFILGASDSSPFCPAVNRDTFSLPEHKEPLSPASLALFAPCQLRLLFAKNLPPFTPLPRPLQSPGKPPHRHSSSESKALKITSHKTFLCGRAFFVRQPSSH